MTKSVRNKSLVAILVSAFILLSDQIFKIWIKTNFHIGQSLNVFGNWFQLYFVENEGIAFGFSFGETYGKLFLSIFRLLASMVVLYLLVRQIKRDKPYLQIVYIAMIFVGAIGNLVDSCFYGLIFSESTHDTVATMFPEGNGYAGFMYGRVVDMLYFPLFEWTWPAWVPWVGGNSATFFNAIFNIADSSVCIGVALYVIDQLWIHSDKKEEKQLSEDEAILPDSDQTETPEQPQTIQ